MYDKVTSSYKLNLPADHYEKFLKKNLPAKEDGRGQWFVRPHHIECLTTHVNSVKDNVMNTNYYSHYAGPPEKSKKWDIEVAIEGLEEHLQEAKDRLRMAQMAAGTYDPDIEEQMEEDPHIHKMARRWLEDLFDDDSKINRQEMLIDTMEHLLLEKRRVERGM